MDEPWKPGRYRDTYTDRVNDLIEAKRRGHEVQQADEPPEATNVIDLLEALRRSVDSARKPRRTTANASKGVKTRPGRTSRPVAKKASGMKQPAKATAKRAAAKETAAKKTSARKPTRQTTNNARESAQRAS